MHNLSTVFWFEVIRTLKKKSFWLLSLSFPLMIFVVVAIIFFSNKATDQAVKDVENQSFSLAVTDESKMINQNLLKGFKAETIKSKAEGIEAVKAGKYDAYFYYPKDVAKQKVEVYGKDVGLFDNSRYDAVAKMFLNTSISQNVSPSQMAIMQDRLNVETTTYRDGQVYDGIKQLIAPGLFLVLFYFLIATFGNQMLTSTTEEKENRVIEMILTTLRARTLVVGKIVSLVVLGLIQSLLVVVPIIVVYVFFRDQLSLPNIDISNIPIDPLAVGLGAVIFFVSFIMFTGVLVTVGAATPTAKEAGMFFGIVMMLIFGPLYAAPLFVSAPDSMVVQVLSYFPLTAPIPLMLRNAIGNLELIEASISIAILLVTTVIILKIAVMVFRNGALEYTKRLSLKEMFNLQ